jgi:hypothetical protein
LKENVAPVQVGAKKLVGVKEIILAPEGTQGTRKRVLGDKSNATGALASLIHFFLAFQVGQDQEW